MSIQQVAFKQQPATHTSRVKAIGEILIGLCILLMFYAVLGGLWIQADYVRLGPIEFFNQKGPAGLSAFYLWLSSLPLAMIFGVVGSAMVGNAKAGRVWALGSAGVVFLIIPVVVGSILGKSIAPIFGAGGILIEVFLVLSLWFYAKERATLTGSRQLAADLHIAGNMFFAFATWFICGIGSMPVYALYPDRMAEFGMLPLATSMMYGIMSFLVIGWGLTFASHFVAARSTQDITRK